MSRNTTACVNAAEVRDIELSLRVGETRTLTANFTAVSPGALSAAAWASRYGLVTLASNAINDKLASVIVTAASIGQDRVTVTATQSDGRIRQQRWIVSISPA